MNDSNPQADHPRWLQEMLREMPWHEPKLWASYRCRSCDNTDWVEEIILDAFPPTEPGGYPALLCPNCGETFLFDNSISEKRSFTKPE